MEQAKTINLMTGRTRTDVEIDTIHYILMKRNYAEIHADWGEVIRARVTMAELEKALGDDFIKVHRSCLVSVAQIHHISDVVVLKSGEKLTYAERQKERIVSGLCAQRGIPDSIIHEPPVPLGRKTKKKKKAPPAQPAQTAQPTQTAQPDQPAQTAPPAQPVQTELPAQTIQTTQPVSEQKPVKDQNGFSWEEFSEERCLPVTVHRKTRLVPLIDILYISAKKGMAYIHTLDGEIIETRTPIHLLEDALGDAFIRVGRKYLASVMSIRSETDAVHFSNGETISYPCNRKAEVRAMLSEKQKLFIERLYDDATPRTEEAYREYYRGFENLPFAFTDIEMVFNEELRAVDWIFRYGNPALARLEKRPLNKLIGKSFGSVFSNMDSKWLRSYEQAVLYRKTLEIMDYSPEIDTNLKIICFPTFRGHCGCMLFDLNSIRLSENSGLQQVLGYCQGMLSESQLSK